MPVIDGISIRCVEGGSIPPTGPNKLRETTAEFSALPPEYLFRQFIKLLPFIIRPNAWNLNGTNMRTATNRPLT